MKEYLISVQEKDNYVWKKTSIPVKGHIREYKGLVFGIKSNGCDYEVTELWSGLIVRHIDKLKDFEDLMTYVEMIFNKSNTKFHSWKECLLNDDIPKKSLNPQYTTSDFYKEMERLTNG
ncbi:MAG: hypothetical protein RR443_08920 [Anaerorhabdus sp.]|uniref:hypothetical protein n=1 Tax=Anaerorhabdus sp. TaxID=1872524 RepID=UPI002FC93E6E